MINFLIIKNKFIANLGLLKNFSYLTILQLLNSLVPIITYPYLIRVLGKETYGLVLYAQVIINYFIIIVNFGFYNLGIKEISIHRENKQKLSEIFHSITIIKLILLVFAFLLLWPLFHLMPVANNHKILFIVSMWACIYDVILPVWFFQGIEKMQYITFLTVISRSIFVILIFIFIKSPDQYLLVPIITGIGAIVAGMIALLIIYKKENLIFFLPSYKSIRKYFVDSIDFFISEVSIKIFASSNKFIIGTFIGLTQLAYYDLAEKIVGFFGHIPLNIVRSSIYPSVAKNKNMALVKQTTFIMSIYSVFIIIIINIFTRNIIIFIAGPEMLPSINVLRIFSLIIFTTHVSNYYLTVGLWSLNYITTFRNIMIFSSLLYLVIYMILWKTSSINLYTVTCVPIIIDIYLIAHVFIFWKSMSYNKLNKV